MSEETFGQILGRFRGTRTFEAVAHAAGISTSYAHKLENGQAIPSHKVAEALDAATNAKGEIIAAREALIAKKAIRPSFAAPSPMRNLEIKGNYEEIEEDVTERRRLLQLAALGVAALTPTEALRQLIDLGTPVTQSIEDWELACTDHLHSIRTRPAREAQQDLHLDLMLALRQMEQTAARLGIDHREVRDLYRVLAGLSTLHANVLTRLGEHAQALRWWRTARHTADASGDLHLRLGVRSTEAGHGLSDDQRDPARVLALIDSARHIMEKAPGSYGAALMTMTEAKALSLLGRHVEAVSALEGVREPLETGHLPVSIVPAYWRNQQLPYAQVCVYSAAGEESRAIDARDRLLASDRDYQYPTTARLLTALCTVVRGGVDQGVQEATAALDTVEPAYRTHLIVHTARRVIRAVPAGQRELVAGDLRAMLAIQS